MISHPPTRIIGGKVFDPVQNLDGKVQDILIEHGRIVDSFLPHTDPKSVRTFDATGKIIMAGGVDMHAHIASQAVNYARALQTTQRAKLALAEPAWFGPNGVSSTGIVPTPKQTGEAYASLGYTTVIEAAVGPSDSPSAHFQLDQTPILDSGILVLLANHELLVELLDADDRAGAFAVAQEILHLTGAYGIKVVNPCGLAAWRRDPSQHRITTIDDKIRGTRVTPRLMLELLTNVADTLKTPHPTHVHGNRLGEPGNYQTLIETLEALPARRVHVAHLQFYGYGATEKNGFTSAADKLCEFFRDHPLVSADVGMVMFGHAVNITADTPLEHYLWRLTGTASRPAVFLESELEAGCGVMPSEYSRKNPIHSLQWAIGLELMLTMPNPWQLSLTIDHPNGGSFLNFPRMIALLMNKAHRDEELANAHPNAAKRSSLGSIQREYTLSDVAIATRAAPARMLGLAQKGHLGPGADADIAIYDDNTANPEAMFSKPYAVFKAGVQLFTPTPAPTPTRLIAPIPANPHGHQLLAQWMERAGSFDISQFGVVRR